VLTMCSKTGTAMRHGMRCDLAKSSGLGLYDSMLQVVTGASFWACLWIAVLANIVVGNAILQLPRTVREWKQTQHTHQSVPEVCWLVIDTNAPDVAPMSYPNNSPPIAGNRNTRDVMSQSTSRGVRAAADMSVCGASCNSKKTPCVSHRKSHCARSVLQSSHI